MYRSEYCLCCEMRKWDLDHVVVCVVQGRSRTSVRIVSMQRHRTALSRSIYDVTITTQSARTQRTLRLPTFAASVDCSLNSTICISVIMLNSTPVLALCHPVRLRVGFKLVKMLPGMVTTLTAIVDSVVCLWIGHLTVFTELMCNTHSMLATHTKILTLVQHPLTDDCIP